MRNATISTSRTRATTEDHLIDYRPLPATWGELESLQQVRAAKARAAARGQDPSTFELAALPSPPESRSVMTRRGRRGLFSSLLREPGVHHRPRRGRGDLATV
ncbi:MAG: hypothetical protein ACTMII_09745 [Brachybacterium sp.]|uniref:hypothetical protein n=1 Tax=unclassified Brachybacterium TaxID=2623841 RepID=UPI003F8F591C